MYFCFTYNFFITINYYYIPHNDPYIKQKISYVIFWKVDTFCHVILSANQDILSSILVHCTEPGSYVGGIYVSKKCGTGGRTERQCHSGNRHDEEEVYERREKISN